MCDSYLMWICCLFNLIDCRFSDLQVIGLEDSCENMFFSHPVATFSAGNRLLQSIFICIKNIWCIMHLLNLRVYFLSVNIYSKFSTFFCCCIIWRMLMPIWMIWWFVDDLLSVCFSAITWEVEASMINVSLIWSYSRNYRDSQEAGRGGVNSLNGRAARKLRDIILYNYLKWNYSCFV